MKIDRGKLNTLLRSGLNPDIKTRKQLAAYLGLDPTSLTRWFANRDRLGNPRYPVVPDRHVTKILALFNLTAQCLSLSDEEFRRHCFELSLSQTKGQNEQEQKSLLRLEQVALRKLSIKEYSAPKNNSMPFLLASALVVVGLGGFFIYGNNPNFWQTSPDIEKNTSNNTKCWSGFSSSLGDFDQKDSSDPCHYGKLLHQALMQINVKNDREHLSIPLGDYDASQAYLLFLSEQLDQRRINDKITLNIELGKSELRRLNYLASQNYFHIASDIFKSSAQKNTQLKAEISAYQLKIKAALNESTIR